MYTQDATAQVIRGFSQLEKIYQNTLTPVQMLDHNEMSPSTPINVQQPTTTGNSPYHIQQTTYGKNALNQNDAKQLAILQAGHQKAQSLLVFGKSNVTELTAGKSLHLDASNFSQAMTNDYIIVEVKHFVAQNIEQQGAEIVYQNDCLLLSRDITFHSVIPPDPSVPPLFHAKIESNTATADLDTHGRYRLRQHFDQSTTAAAQASPPIPRLQPSGGNSNDSQNPPVGFHTPLLEGAEILVSCLHGDPDRPVIFNTPTNTEQLSQ